MNNPIKAPKLSIIIPSFNDGDKLFQLLSSIKAQTFINYEVLLIDGGSKDNTEEVVDLFKTTINLFVSEADQGIFDAMNKGIEKAKGEWLYFIGCDDSFYDKNVLTSLFNDPKSKECDIFYGKVFNVAKNKVEGQEFRSNEEFLSTSLWHQSMFYKKEVFTQVGNFKIKYKIAADSYFNLLLYAKHQFKWSFSDIIVCNYSGSGLSSKAFDKAYHLDLYSTYLELFKNWPKAILYNALQHHLYNEIKYGSLLKAGKEFWIIYRKTGKVNPYIKNSLYWLRYRLLKMIKKNKRFSNKTSY